MTTVSKIYIEHKSTIFIKILAFGVASALLIVLYLYNANVNLRHEMEMRTKALHTAATMNTKLHNELYALTDVVALKRVAAERNLIEDKNPNYFKEGASLWAVAR